MLGLPTGLAAEVDRDRLLRSAPAVRVDQLYTGVLYDALDLASLDPAARRRANRALVVLSGLWGALRLTDRVPAYRLAPDVALPGTGPVAALWRPVLPGVLEQEARRGLVLDLRSTAYTAMGRLTGPVADRTRGRARPARTGPGRAGVAGGRQPLQQGHEGTAGPRAARTAPPTRAPRPRW